MLTRLCLFSKAFANAMAFQAKNILLPHNQTHASIFGNPTLLKSKPWLLKTTIKKVYLKIYILRPIPSVHSGKLPRSPIIFKVGKHTV